MRNLKRALSLAVASVMLLGMMVVGTSAGYADVTSKHNEEAIDVVKAVGIMIGDDKGNFNPDQKVTRNEMAVVMANMLDLKISDYNGVKLAFTDVPDWAAPYVAACYANKIVSGTSATTYGGSATVTAAEASLMIMKALGYFENQGDFGDDWKIATIKQASKIELTNGIEAGANTALTRNEVAQLVLNALEADMVDFTGSYGTDIKTSDGTTITVDYVSEYSAVKSSKNDYNDSDDGVKQLCEELYGDDLQKTTGTPDAFGRPSTKWEYENEEIGKYADEADKVYAGKISHEDLYDDLSLDDDYNDFNYFINGKRQKDVDVDKNDDDTNFGKKGQTVEVYFDKKDASKRVIVVIGYYIDEIDDVDTNDDDERIVKIGSLEYKTEGFEEGDMVIYTKADDEIKSMALAEKQTGKITKTVGDDVVYIDGTKYTLSETSAAEIYGYAAKDEVEFYLDPAGFILKMDKVDGEVNLDNLALVVEADNARGNYAVLRLADGTKMTVDTDKKYGGENPDENLVNRIVSFEEGDDGYELDGVNGTKLAKVSNAFTKGKSTLKVQNDEGKTINVKTDSQTVFVYEITDGKDSEFEVYNGFKNAPTLNGDSQVACYREDDDAAILVYVVVADENLGSTADDLTFVVYDSDVKKVDDGDTTVYYEYNAIVDGEITTVMIMASNNFVKNDAEAGEGVMAIYKDLTLKSDGVAKSGTTTNDYKTVTKTEAESNETIGLGDELYAYTDDVKVFFVDDDLNITEGNIGNIKKDNDGTKNPYANIYFTLDDDDAVETIVIVEK